MERREKNEEMMERGEGGSLNWVFNAERGMWKEGWKDAGGF